MKKMKGVVAMESSPYALYKDPRNGFKHQSLLQDFEELQKVISFVGFSRFVISVVGFIRSDVLFDFLVGFVHRFFGFPSFGFFMCVWLLRKLSR
jgi:hypothetical protein